MPRIRYLKPEFFTDEDLASLPILTRVAFAGLWCYADKAGRLEDRPRFLKAMIFPYDKVDMDAEIQSLSNGKGFIQRYEIEGRKYIQIVNWDKHQKPHHTEAESKIPPAPPLKEKGMEKGMEKQLEASTELRNVHLTVKSHKVLKEKKIFGEFQNVSLTEDEYEKLCKKFTEIGAKSKIENLSIYLASKGKKYSNHYATILAWERNPQPARINPPKYEPKDSGTPEWMKDAVAKGWKV